MYSKNIKNFTEGVTIIGGLPTYEVDINNDKGIILITYRSHYPYSLRSKKDLAKEIRETFQMSENEYKLVSIMSTKRGIKFTFKLI